PIGSITNGVHTFSWISQEMNELFGRYLDKDWGKYVDQPEFWNERINNIPDEELWRTHGQSKDALLGYARHRLKRQHIRLGEGSHQIAEFDQMLDPNALTIGFA